MLTADSGNQSMCCQSVQFVQSLAGRVQGETRSDKVIVIAVIVVATFDSYSDRQSSAAN